jgi:hypothetical protein
MWGTCVGDVRPATEVCMGSTDESCDGEVNEYCPCEAIRSGASMTLDVRLRGGDTIFHGLRFHFLGGDVASGPGRPAWGEIEVRCDATGTLFRRFRHDVGDFELFYESNSAGLWEYVMRVDSGHPDGVMLFVQISRAGG